jgi:hypothetical protein
VLPAWATITIAAISAAAGILGAFVVTWIRIGFDRDESLKDRAHERELQERRLDHERAEQWRDRRVRAADDFSTGVQQALLRVHEAIQAAAMSEESTSKQVAEAGVIVAEAERVIGEAIARVGRIKLLFGEESKPTKIAEQLLRQLEVSLTPVKGVDVVGVNVARNVPDAWKAIEKAYGLHAEFNRAALDVINQ